MGKRGDQEQRKAEDGHFFTAQYAIGRIESAEVSSMARSRGLWRG